MADPAAMAGGLRMAAGEIQALRGRIDLLRLERLSDLLVGWLDLHGAPKPGGWTAVADGIAVTPGAVYHELARRHGARGVQEGVATA